MCSTGNFDRVLYGISDNIKPFLQNLSAEIKEKTDEIRLRNGLPLALTIDGKTVFLRKDGGITYGLSHNLLTVTKADVEQSFRKLCKNSVYAHTSELQRGFIKIDGGCRVGVCGSFGENGEFSDVSSLNIRIAREIAGAADTLIKNYSDGGWLIAGPPGSGKTTVLRDFIRQISSGALGCCYRVAVVDSRGELSGSSYGERSNDLGNGSDVILIADKARGIEMAVRTLFPDIVAFDEIGTLEELTRVAEGFCAGVSVITTAHIGKLSDLVKRQVTLALLKSGAVENIALMPKNHNGEIEIISVKEILKDAAS